MPRYCIYKDCKTRTSYGKIGGTPEYCFTHKTSDMINLLNETQKRCDVEGCKKQPNYAIKVKLLLT